MANTVLITGANRGIGFAVAQQLGEKGWTILLGARDQGRGQAAVAQLQAAGIIAEWIKIDLNDPETIHTAAMTVAQAHPELKVLVNNAGIAADMQAAPLATAINDLQAALQVNVVGTFAMIKAFTPILQRNSGRIVNLTIPVNATRFFHPFSYVISKTALNKMIKLFAQSFKAQRLPVEICGMMPGGVSTDLNGHRQSPFIRPVAEGASAVIKVVVDPRHHQGQIVTNYGLLPGLKRLLFQH
ncbi:SDR family NAD(P)-dependent oxidoreductase [Lacticaseibacillus baoqingensis]|uniref:SDR family NAD(P)-dependent oxidoreductase n=1 Tax=Lacticaseibacillus baoqingensis TaxID=2486013 RepID=A0ABW4E3U1_9LACO|nr:SDR family NAD(P)-dependent oxidoreductase [Lacticaseibacillus baoqingensis]